MLFGRNPVGTAVGAALLSLWAFVQPILTLYLFFGNSLLDAGAFYFEKVQSKLGVGGEQLVYAFSAIVLIKLLLAVLIGGILVPLNEKRLLGFSFSKFEKHRSEIRNKIMQRQSTDGGHSIFLLALKDLFQPLFFFSFFLGVVFVVFSTSDHAKIIWLALRPIAVAYLFFVFCRSSFFRELPKKLGRFTFFERFAHFFDQTLGILLIDSKLDKVEKSEPN